MSTENKTRDEIAAELLAKYKAADDETSRIKGELEAANKAKSDVVKEMNDILGKGPYSYRGQFLGKIICRGGTYFFRGRSDSDDAIKVG